MNIRNEYYLDETANIQHIIKFTKLRISNRSLEIEKGRHQRRCVKLKDRVCQTCKLETEDEAHFLLRCRIIPRVTGHSFRENEVKR